MSETVTREEYNKIVEAVNTLRRNNGEEELPLHKGLHQAKQKLFDHLADYRPPIYGSQTEYWNQAKQTLTRALEAQMNKKKFCERNNIPYNDAETKELESMDKNLIKKDRGRSLGYNFITRCHDLILPFQETIKLEDFDHVLELLPCSDNSKPKKLSLTNSLPPLLDLCQSKGLMLDQLNIIFILIIKKYLPEHANIAQSYNIQQHPIKIFRLLMAVINPTKENEYLNDLIASVTRKPSENIGEVTEKLKSYHQMSLKIIHQQPNVQFLQNKAARSVLLVLHGFVTTEVWNKVKLWRDQETRKGRDLTLDDYINKIMEIETNPKFRPTTTLRIKDSVDYKTLNSTNKVSAKSINRNYETDSDDSYSKENSEADAEDDYLDPDQSDYDVNWTSARRGRSRKARGRSSRAFKGRRSPKYGSGRRNASTSRRRSSSYDRNSTSRPPKRFTLSPGGTYRNRSTGSSRGRARSSASTNTTTSTNSVKYPSNSSNSNNKKKSNSKKINLVTESSRNCLKCNSSKHISRLCPRFTSYEPNLCDWCWRKNGIALYHKEENCLFKKEHTSSSNKDRRSNYREPSANTKDRRIQRKQERLNSKQKFNKSSKNFSRQIGSR